MKQRCNHSTCLPNNSVAVDFLTEDQKSYFTNINIFQSRPQNNSVKKTLQNKPIQQQKFDQFWDGNDSITIPGPNPAEIGRLFVTSNTTSNPGAGPSTIDTWTEDWVITDWNAYQSLNAAGAPNPTPLAVTYDNVPVTASDYIIGNGGINAVHRMILVFQYQTFPTTPANAPASTLPHKHLYAVKSLPTPNITTGYLYRELSNDGKVRLELWALFADYNFPSTPNAATHLMPVAGNTIVGAAPINSPAEFITQMIPFAPQYYVETVGVFKQQP